MGRLLWWLGPILFLLWLDRYGLKVWFLQDDFAWLGLLRDVEGSRTLANALFAPEAQGTIRPWSERGFFLLFESLFGLNSFPYHFWTFLTLAADVVLIAWITLRATGSRLAGFMAPVLWVANAALSTVLAWSSSYNQALCAFFLLAALGSFIRFLETGRKFFWWLQLVVFILGFGALEVNVVYPALAVSWALFIPRVPIRRILITLSPLFVLSVLYFVLHSAAAPLPATGAYAVHIDRRIFATLGTYWTWSVAPRHIAEHLSLQGKVLLGLATLAINAFCIREAFRKRFEVFFFGSFFLITLAPMLSLPEHLTDYYVAIPVIGLSMLMATAVDRAFAAGWPWRIAAVVSFIFWARMMVVDSVGSTRWWLENSQAARGLVLGVQAAQAAHPDKTIVLDGVTSDLYNFSLADNALISLGIDQAYLTPGSDRQIRPDKDPVRFADLVVSPGVMRRAAFHDAAVVYSPVGDHLRNITRDWEQSVLPSVVSSAHPDRQPRRIDVGNPLLAFMLGPEWYAAESGVRWIPQRASVQLGGPESDRDRLVLEGSCPEQQLQHGPLHLLVTADGILVENVRIGTTDVTFRRSLALPSVLVGRPHITVGLSVDRVIRDPGGRVLGLIFGTIAIEH